MEYEITPEPTPEEREAIAAALTGLESDAGRESAWWWAGVRENVEPES